MGEVVKVTGVTEEEFVFTILPTHQQKCLIKSEMANMLKGGYEELMDIETAINDNYRKHIEHNIEVYGKEKFNQLNSRYVDLFDLIKKASTEDEKNKLNAEQDELFNKINTNKYFKRFIEFTETRDFYEDFITMKVTCTHPVNFNWKSLTPEQELELLKIYKQKKNQVKFSKGSKS